MTSIEIGGVLFAEYLDHSTSWTGFYFNENEDWYSLPQSKARNDPRPNAHGSFGGGFDWREGLVLTVKGGYVGTDAAAALQAMDDLKLALAIGSEMPMVVDDSLRSTSRSVSIRFLTIPDHKGRRRFEFAIDMFAKDPLRYGDEVAVSTGLPVPAGGLIWPITWPITWDGGGSEGRVVLVNSGSADTTPRMLEITGGLAAGFTIDEVGTGRQTRFERVIPDDSTIFLNPRTGRAYIDAPGNDVSGYLTRSDWPVIPRRGQSILQFNSLGASSGVPTLTARYAPAFW